MGAIGAIAADVLAPAVGSVLGPVLGDIGGALGLGGALGGVTKGLSGILDKALQAFNPLGSLVSNFLPSLVQQQRPAFSPGGLNPGIINDPIGSLFGKGGSQGSQGGINANNLTVGGENFQQIQGDINAAAKSGDPAAMFAAQQKMDQFTQMMTTLSSMEKAMHDMMMAIARNIA